MVLANRDLELTLVDAPFFPFLLAIAISDLDLGSDKS
jgi:hypothetical protein